MNSTKNFRYLDDLIHSGVKEIVLDSDIVLSDDEILDNVYSIKLDVDNLVIDGNGHAIDGREETCAILCTGKNITIKNITIKKIKFKDPLMKRGMWSAINNCWGKLTIIDSIFEDNCGFGGVIYNQEGILNIINCKFTNNFAARVGGAIHNDEGSIMINNSIFANNEAIHDGGAIYNPRGILSIENSEFHNNVSGYDGGAIYNPNDNLSLRNCIFKDNEHGDVYKW